MVNKLDFICTVRNGERYLDECIQSVVENYPDAEFVIVDDGSTDGTPAILERWAAAVPQIRVISTGGVGRGAALNMAVEACTRPYIANIDADDIALPGRDALVDHLEGTDGSVAVAAGTSLLLVEVSEKHGGFIVRKGVATGQELLELIEHIQTRVLEEYGVHPELEQRII